MGNCQYGKCPVQMPNNPNAPIGQVYPVRYACSDVASTPRGTLCPANDEWEAVNAGECKYDSLANGCELVCSDGSCQDAHCQIAGARTGCRRTQFSADPTQCCVQNRSTIGTLTCDPKYRGSQQEDCFPLMNVYCDDSTKFFTGACKEWLQNISRTNPGTANQLANKYCPGSTDLFCSCYNVAIPPDLNPAAQGIFRCLDKACGTNQQALNTLICPNVYQDCSISNVDVTLNNSTAEKIRIANECCAGSCPPSGSPPPSTSPSPSPTPSPTPAPSTGTGLSPTAIAAIVVGALLIIAIIVFVVLLSRKKGPAPTAPRGAASSSSATPRAAPRAAATAKR